jgi:biotin carboxyl carrier protein
MEKRFRITVDGRPYNVTVEDLSDAGGAAGITGPASAPTVTAPAPSAPRPSAAPGAPRPSASPDDVLCTLGGVVESLHVNIGQAVQKGDRVVVIEAMKMKTPMLAHRDGVVKAVAVKLGEAVEAGQALLTIG